MRKALLTLLALALVSAPTAVASEPRFCKSATLHDYLKPLQRMPELRELPFRRRAEPLFRGVRIGAAGPTLAVNGGRAGYQLQWDGNPRWEITLTFEQVTPSGSVIKPLGRRHLRLGALAPALITEPAFTMSGKPAFYRTTLAIRSASGRKLAEFGNYYRVIRPSVHVRLATDAPTYRPGDTLLARVEDHGAAFVLFGEELAIEKREGEAWIPAPGLPGPVVTPLTFVAPGTTSNLCAVFPIPTSMPAGRYRASQETVISWPYERHEQRPFLRAEFDVAP